ncbi:VCBS repeat-containing protein [Danxiaibacter flavus]|uniref:VCBS repeat-containing protein n=1 Tax=Danxiaibacter flavus TaxID=3049108 RepID=A0ABV3ZLM9_9BACT|nr:VCBS repeat-containing protein [Chitinophagaceae bacterium DXS]
MREKKCVRPVAYENFCRSTLLTALFTCLFICYSSGSYSQKLFKLLAARQTGIKFSNEINETEGLNVMAYEYFYNGGGVAVGDINNDGLEDLFFTANMKPNKLYLNLGNMKFKDITKEACKEMEGKSEGWKTGATMADVNGDGLLDIYVCYSGKVSEDLRRNQLFINQGNLKFTEQAKQYGLDDPGYSTQAAFFDYDNDGDLDMFLLNHNVRKIDNMELARFRNQTDPLAGSRLYENRNGHFIDVSSKAGIYQYPLTFGLGIAIADVNKDGWQDVYVTNDYNEPDYLYINNHDGTFKEDAEDCFRHLSQFSMGVDIADYNNDGLPDIVTLDMLPPDNRRQKLLQLQENYESFQLMKDQGLNSQYMRNMLQLNNGDNTFSEIGQLAGISATDWSWCPLLADFDNDGYKDLLVTNGYLRDYTNKDFLRYWGDYKIKKAIERAPEQLMDLVKSMPSTALENYVFKNNRDLTFSNVQQEWGLNNVSVSSGAVYADLDNDGDLDLVINNINQEAFVYQNMQHEERGDDYLNIRLKDYTANTSAFGAKIYAYESGLQQYVEVNPARGYLSSVSTNTHFGFSKATTIDSIRIIWPDNTTQLVSNVKVNQQLVIEHKKGLPVFDYSVHKKANAIFTKAPAPVDHKREEFTENDFKRQLLMLFMYSQTGPVIAHGDVNNDGKEDLFVSGDKATPGKIYLQQANGSFKPVGGSKIGDEATSASSAACFFDANGDGFADLYVAKGGYSLFQPGSEALQDELYINDKKGNFYLALNALPVVTASSKSCVRPCDYDNDGDIDLFVGGRVIPGNYPAAPESYLLNNNGRGVFSLVDVPFKRAGMITDAQWTDLNGDGRKDLVLCGEMMPVMIFLNTTNGFVDKSAEFFSMPDKGFWNTIAIADVNRDGMDDIIAGNLGLNSQIHISDSMPAELYYADFDHNGSIDPFFNFYIQGKSYPFVSRDELNEQMYSMRKKFISYKAYADATMKDIIPPEELVSASKLTANESRSVVYLNKGNKFEKVPLPLQAQFSMVCNILPYDFNNDGKMDLLLFGNHTDNRLKLGSIDANYGCLLQGDGKGNFVCINQADAGICIKGDVKSAGIITIKDQRHVIVGVPGDVFQTYKIGK